MDTTQKVEAPHKQTWTEKASELMHDHPYVDMAIGGAVVAAGLLSRGKLSGAAERMFPEAATLLGEIAEKEVPAIGRFISELPGKDPSLTATQLSELADHELSAVKYSVATHPNVTSDTLARLAKNGDNSILETVASNAKTNTETLDTLANLSHAASPINLRIAGNPSTGIETLGKQPIDALTDFRRQLTEAKTLRVDGISMDMWWRMVNPEKGE